MEGVSSPGVAVAAAPAAAVAGPETPRAAGETVEKVEGTTAAATTAPTTTTTAATMPANGSSSAAGTNGAIVQNGAGPGTPINHSTARTPVAKDKQCLYCHMSFTSSALGRHYDQFLCKKKPDGVHNVDEIRQMRSGITRRTARTSAAAELAKQEQGFSASVSDAGSVASMRPGQGLPLPPPLAPESYPPVADNRQVVLRPAAGQYQVYCGPPPYTTQVVNDSPSGPSKTQAELQANAHAMRAMELALRETLDTIKAAASRVHARVLPFDFELRSQTFPSLCLHALPPPDTIFTPSPFPSDKSFTIHPPTAALREIIQSSLRTKVEQWREEQLEALATPKSKSSPANPNKLRAETDLIERQARQHERMILKHLDLSLKHWETLSPEQQRDQWHLEIMRALAHESQKRHDLEERLNRAHQESDRLRAHLEKMSSLHFPREFALLPPNLAPMPTAVARELKALSEADAADPSKWDYDTVLAKWQHVVQHDRAYVGTATPGPSNQIQNQSQHSMPSSLPSPAPGPSSSVPPPIQSPAYNNGPYVDSGYAYNHTNGYTTPTIHTNQAPPPERFAPYSLPEPASKRRRLSSGAAPINHNLDIVHTQATQQLPQPQQQPMLSSYQQPTAMGPPIVNEPQPQKRKAPLTQQYRFKYTSGPNTPKASSLHSPPAQNGNYAPATPAQTYPAAAPTSAGPADYAPQQPATPSPSLPTAQEAQSSQDPYSAGSQYYGDAGPAPATNGNGNVAATSDNIATPTAATPQSPPQSRPQTAAVDDPMDMDYDGGSPSVANLKSENVGSHHESQSTREQSPRSRSPAPVSGTVDVAVD